MKTRSSKVIGTQDDVTTHLPADEPPLGESPESPDASKSAGPSAGTGVVSQASNVKENESVRGTTSQLSQPQDSHANTSQSQVSSIPVSLTNSTALSLLPDNIFVSSSGKPYDRDWMVKHGVDEEILQGFSSKTQFRTLVSNKVIKNGDRLRVTFGSGNGLIHKEGTIMQGPVSWIPDILIPVSRPGVASITLRGCAGPVDFINTMNGEFSASHGNCLSKGWRAVHLLSSDGRDLGTLWMVRQAYHIWVEEKDKWAARNNQPLSYHQHSSNPRPATNLPRQRGPRQRRPKAQ